MEFIRLDIKGTWKDINHRSCFAGSSLVDADENIKWEKGISCYNLENTLDAIENLYKYWSDIAMLSLDDYKNMQVTIFAGEKLDGCGSDGEDMAICTQTIKTLEAYDFIKKLEEYKEMLENYEEGYEDEPQIDDNKYEELVVNLI